MGISQNCPSPNMWEAPFSTHWKWRYHMLRTTSFSDGTTLKLEAFENHQQSPIPGKGRYMYILYTHLYLYIPKYKKSDFPHE